jgi:hypothetical protein
MQIRDDVEVHREAVLRRWADSPRHSRMGLHAEYVKAQAMQGRLVHTKTGEEVILTKEIPLPPGHPFSGANRATRRAAEARARRRA